MCATLFISPYISVKFLFPAFTVCNICYKIDVGNFIHSNILTSLFPLLSKVKSFSGDFYHYFSKGLKGVKQFSLHKELLNPKKFWKPNLPRLGCLLFLTNLILSLANKKNIIIKIKNGFLISWIFSNILFTKNMYDVSSAKSSWVETLCMSSITHAQA